MPSSSIFQNGSAENSHQYQVQEPNQRPMQLGAIQDRIQEENRRNCIGQKTNVTLGSFIWNFVLGAASSEISILQLKNLTLPTLTFVFFYGGIARVLLDEGRAYCIDSSIETLGEDQVISRNQFACRQVAPDLILTGIDIASSFAWGQWMVADFNSVACLESFHDSRQASIVPIVVSLVTTGVAVGCPLMCNYNTTRWSAIFRRRPERLNYAQQASEPDHVSYQNLNQDTEQPQDPIPYPRLNPMG